MKTNKGRVPITIVLLIIAVLAVGGVSYYVGKKSNNKKVEEVKNNLTAQVSQKVSTDLKYEDTPESKMAYYSESVFLESFEKREDGYWYLALDPTDNILPSPNNNGNRDRTFRTFRASPDLKIVMSFGQCIENDPTFSEEKFDSYISRLTKKDNYYWNPNNKDPAHYNGFYSVVVQNGIITGMEEVDYTCGD